AIRRPACGGATLKINLFGRASELVRASMMGMPLPTIQLMSSTPFAESIAEALSARLSAAQRVPARRWLDQLNTLLLVEKREIFPGEQMLDHLPQLIAEIAGFMRAPGAE